MSASASFTTVVPLRSVTSQQVALLVSATPESPVTRMVALAPPPSAAVTVISASPSPVTYKALVGGVFRTHHDVDAHFRAFYGLYLSRGERDALNLHFNAAGYGMSFGTVGGCGGDDAFTLTAGCQDSSVVDFDDGRV